MRHEECIAKTKEEVNEIIDALNLYHKRSVKRYFLQIDDMIDGVRQVNIRTHGPSIAIHKTTVGEVLGLNSDDVDGLSWTDYIKAALSGEDISDLVKKYNGHIIELEQNDLTKKIVLQVTHKGKNNVLINKIK